MTETTKITGRIAWIDFAKALCITLVVLGHIPMAETVN